MNSRCDDGEGFLVLLWLQGLTWNVKGSKIYDTLLLTAVVPPIKPKIWTCYDLDLSDSSQVHVMSLELKYCCLTNRSDIKKRRYHLGIHQWEVSDTLSIIRVSLFYKICNHAWHHGVSASHIRFAFLWHTLFRDVIISKDQKRLQKIVTSEDVFQKMTSSLRLSMHTYYVLIEVSDDSCPFPTRWLEFTYNPY